jgi:branched-chain amino acid transport system substrate-binding protein
VRTFVRLAPSDEQQVRAQLAYMRAAGVHRLFVLADGSVFDADIAAIVDREAPANGVSVVDYVAADATTAPGSIVAKLRRDGADALFFGGDPTPRATAIWTAVNAADPSLKLFAPSELASPDFLQTVGSARRRAYVTSPVLPLRFYPPAAQRFAKDYAATFGVAPDAYALYGYEAVRATLAAIHAAGRSGADRNAVRRAWFAMRGRDSVLGRYSVDAGSGETSMSQFGGYRVGAGGKLVFDRLLGPAPSAGA